MIFIKRRKAIKDKYEGQLAGMTTNDSDNSGVDFSGNSYHFVPQNDTLPDGRL